MLDEAKLRVLSEIGNDNLIADSWWGDRRSNGVDRAHDAFSDYHWRRLNSAQEGFLSYIYLFCGSWSLQRAYREEGSEMVCRDEDGSKNWIFKCSPALLFTNLTTRQWNTRCVMCGIVVEIPNCWASDQRTKWWWWRGSRRVLCVTRWGFEYIEKMRRGNWEFIGRDETRRGQCKAYIIWLFTTRRWTAASAAAAETEADRDFIDGHAEKNEFPFSAVKKLSIQPDTQWVWMTRTETKLWAMITW